MSTYRLARPLPDGVTDTFIRPCLDCGDTLRVVDGAQEPHEHHELLEGDSLAAFAWWEGYDRGANDRLQRAHRLLGAIEVTLFGTSWTGRSAEDVIEAARAEWKRAR